MMIMINCVVCLFFFNYPLPASRPCRQLRQQVEPSLTINTKRAVCIHESSNCPPSTCCRRCGYNRGAFTMDSSRYVCEGCEIKGCETDEELVTVLVLCSVSCFILGYAFPMHVSCYLPSICVLVCCPEAGWESSSSLDSMRPRCC